MRPRTRLAPIHPGGRQAGPFYATMSDTMPVAVPFLDVPPLAPTDRLVALPPARLRDARTGGRPRLATSVRVGLRGDTLCVRFDGRDEGVVATLTERDAPLWQEDVFEVFLAPSESPRVYYEIEVNPLGAIFDARIHSPELIRASMRVDPSWDCPGLETRVTRRLDRWSAMLRIPLGPLHDGTRPPRWRANFYRIDRGNPDEYSAWAPTLSDPVDFHVPDRFGWLHLPHARGSSADTVGALGRLPTTR